MPHYTFEGNVTLADKARSPFLYLPFQVPPEAGCLTVRYTYSNYMPADESWGGNTLDIGVFGPGGIAFGSADFRGWSGSFRQEFTITPADATPGYLPGLPPGLWHVLLGLYNIAVTGCQYRVEIDLSPVPPNAASLGAEQPPVQSLSPAAVPASAGAPTPGQRWFKGDLHCHTIHSDGENSLEELIRTARAIGLDFLAVTEHNTVSHLPYLHHYAAPNFLPIPGEELTTYSGHANVWGIQGWVDFRCITMEDWRRVAAMARRQGALLSINHPKSGGPPWEYGLDLDFDCLEVWQAHFWLSNYESLALWDSLLRQGRRVVAVGGSDAHRIGTPEAPPANPLGIPTTLVYAPALTQEAILEAIKKGHVAVTREPAGPELEFTASLGDRATGANPLQAKAKAGKPAGTVPGEPNPSAGNTFIMGDAMAVPGSATITFTARVRRAGGNLLRLISPQGVAALVPVEGDDFTYIFRATPKALGKGQVPLPYLRAEVIQPPEADLEQEPAALMVEVLGNPIYIYEEATPFRQ